MMSEPIPPISISSGDLSRLKKVAVEAVSKRHPIGRFLLSELERATVHEPAVASNRCARLDDWVTFRADENEPLESRVLVLPDGFRNSTLHLSVLSPLGAALIGLHAGSRIRYVGFDGVPHIAAVENLEPPAGVISLLQRRSMKPAHQTDNNPDRPGPTAA